MRTTHIRAVTGIGSPASSCRQDAAGTRLADTHQGVSDKTWAQMREHYDDEQITGLVSLIAVINAANRFNVIIHNKGGSYEPGALTGYSES